MNSATYKNLIKILEKWPLDKLKTGRDFGEFFRESITASFIKEPVKPNLEVWDKIVKHLTPLANDKYLSIFDNSNSKTAFGLSKQANIQATSNEYFKYLEEEFEKGYIANRIKTLKSKFQKEPIEEEEVESEVIEKKRSNQIK